jgi:hypothetical protein
MVFVGMTKMPGLITYNNTGSRKGRRGFREEPQRIQISLRFFAVYLLCALCMNPALLDFISDYITTLII